MKISKLSSFYIKTKIIEHSYNKDKLLSLINKGNFSSFDNIYKTDWHFDKNTEREYLNLFYKIITPYMNNMCLKIKAKTWRIHNGWFQQYKKNNFHDWHRHSSSVFNNIYYVDLPAGASKTTFRFLGKEFQVEVKEGQILSFPSFFEHCSKPNLSDNIKTVIAFNSN